MERVSTGGTVGGGLTWRHILIRSTDRHPINGSTTRRIGSRIGLKTFCCAKGHLLLVLFPRQSAHAPSQNQRAMKSELTMQALDPRKTLQDQ
jgi:hypothetical protein